MSPITLNVAPPGSPAFAITRQTDGIGTLDAASFTCSYVRVRVVVATTIRPSLNSTFAIGNALEALDDEPNDE
jgi:hypothetical protein